MQVALNLHIVLPFVAFLVCLHLILRVAHYRSAPMAGSFIALMSALAIWTLAVTLEHASIGLSAKVLWLKLSYLGILSLPLAWLSLTLRYSGRERWLTRRKLVLLSILPVVTLIMVWTNGLHGLMWRDIWLDSSFSPPVDDVTHGPWFWIQAGYSYLMVLAGTLLLAHMLRHGREADRKQVGVMLLGALVPWVANVLYITPSTVFQVLDPTPLAFVATGLAFSWGLFRLRLLDIMPVAHEAMFAHMSDGVVVLDARGLIVELNPVAESIVGMRRAKAIGMAYGLALPELAGRLEFTAEYSDLQLAMQLGAAEQARHFAVSVSPFAGNGAFGGCLLLLHDDTGRMRTESEARERIRLEAELVARRRSEETLRVSEAKYRNLVQNAASGIIVCDDAGRVLTANRAALSIFRCANEQEMGQTPAAQLFVNPDDAGRLLDPIARTGVARGIEALMRRRDGGVFWAALNVIVQTAESGENQYLAIVDDVTARKNTDRELTQSRQNLRLLAQRIEQAREDERTSLARELHDQVGQTFTAIRMDLDRIRRHIMPDDHDATALLEGMAKMVDVGTDDVRRISSELRPGALDDLGLAGAIEFHLSQTALRAGLEYSFTCAGGDCELDGARSTALFRVFQELLTNVVRHAHARVVSVTLGREDNDCVLTLSDDGCGIDMREVSNSHSLGIVGMKERLLPYQGGLQLAGEPGKGTKARVTMPLTQA